MLRLFVAVDFQPINKFRGNGSSVRFDVVPRAKARLSYRESFYLSVDVMKRAFDPACSDLGDR
jgi:hypothetical protein